MYSSHQGISFILTIFRCLLFFCVRFWCVGKLNDLVSSSISFTFNQNGKTFSQSARVKKYCQLVNARASYVRSVAMVSISVYFYRYISIGSIEPWYIYLWRQTRELATCTFVSHAQPKCEATVSSFSSMKSSVTILQTMPYTLCIVVSCIASHRISNNELAECSHNMAQTMAFIYRTISIKCNINSFSMALVIS